MTVLKIQFSTRSQLPVLRLCCAPGWVPDIIAFHRKHGTENRELPYIRRGIHEKVYCSFYIFPAGYSGKSGYDQSRTRVPGRQSHCRRVLRGCSPHQIEAFVHRSRRFTAFRIVPRLWRRTGSRAICVSTGASYRRNSALRKCSVSLPGVCMLIGHCQGPCR